MKVVDEFLKSKGLENHVWFRKLIIEFLDSLGYHKQ